MVTLGYGPRAGEGEGSGAHAVEPYMSVLPQGKQAEDRGLETQFCQWAPASKQLEDWD